MNTNIIKNPDMTIKELYDLLKQGDENASDILWELSRQDTTKAWDYVGIENVETYLDNSGCSVKPQEVIDYMKDGYELIDVESEIRNVVEYLDED